MLLWSMAHNVDGCVTVGHLELSKRRGKSRATIERHIAVLSDSSYIRIKRNFDYMTSSWGPNTYYVVRPGERFSSTVSVENKSTNDPTPILKNEGAFNYLNTLNSNTEIHTPVGVSVCVDIPVEVVTPEPQRPVPSPEVFASEQLGRELRRQRHSDLRQAHYREVREAGPGRRCAPPKPQTPAHVAAHEILRLCGVSVASPRLLTAIVEALDLQVEISGKTPRHWVEDAVMSWRTYCEEEFLLCRYGLERFFSDGLWCNQRLWRYDYERRRQALRSRF